LADEEGCSFDHSLIRFRNADEERSVMDVAEHMCSAEAVNKEIERLSVRRSQKEADPDEREELWKASVRAYNEKRRQAARLEWHRCSIAGRLRGTGRPCKRSSNTTRNRWRS
jgi:hypothetical protein